jgi:hypothetical protein
LLKEIAYLDIRITVVRILYFRPLLNMQGLQCLFNKLAVKVWIHHLCTVNWALDRISSWANYFLGSGSGRRMDASYPSI